MQAARRPWVSASVSFGDVIWGLKGASFPIRTELKNTGQSPAMHVVMREAILPFMAANPRNTPMMWLKETAAQMKLDSAEGAPLFPGEPQPRTEHLIFAREEAERFRQLINHARHSADDPLPRPNTDAHLRVPVAFAYVIDYQADVGGKHHQTYCWISIDRADRNRPNMGISIPLDENVSASDLRPRYGVVGCGAD
jgi:hypothetical protein